MAGCCMGCCQFLSLSLVLDIDDVRQECMGGYKQVCGVDIKMSLISSRRLSMCASSSIRHPLFTATISSPIYPYPIPGPGIGLPRNSPRLPTDLPTRLNPPALGIYARFPTPPSSSYIPCPTFVLLRNIPSSPLSSSQSTFKSFRYCFRPSSHTARPVVGYSRNYGRRTGTQTRSGELRASDGICFGLCASQGYQTQVKKDWTLRYDWKPQKSVDQCILHPCDRDL